MADLRALISALGDEQRRYTVETLATHLAAADRYDRLRALFNDDGWLQIRFEYSGFVYSSYLADLSLAWEGFAHQRTYAEADRGDEPVSIVDVARFALIRTSLNSVGSNIPPQIAARAVETGLWSAERALSLAERIPGAVQRAELFVKLLAQNKLIDAQRDRARNRALDAVGEFGGNDDRANTLAALVPHLTPVFADRAVALALGAHKDARSRSLAAVVPLLAGETRRALITEAVELAHSSSSQQSTWHDVAAALDANLDGDLIALAVERVRKAVSSSTRASALAALSCRLPEAVRGPIAEEAVAALRQIPDDKDRVYSLREVLQDLYGGAKLEACNLALETALRLPPIDREYDIPQVVGLLAAVPGLDAGGLERATEAAMALPDIGIVRNSTVNLLAALAARLQGKRREQVVNRAVALACKPQDAELDEGSWEIEPYVTILPLLGAELRSTLIRKSFDRALQLLPLEQRNDLVRPRAQAIAMLTPFLPPDLVDHAYRSSRQVEDDEARVKALAALSSHLNGADRNSVLRAAVASLAEIDAGGLRASALAAISPLIANDQVEDALDAALHIRGEHDRGKALQEVNPHVTEGLTEKALSGTLAIKFEPSRADALVTLIPALPQARLEFILEKAWAIQWEPGRTECIAAIARRLPADRQSEVLELALDAYRSRKQDHMSGDMLVALAPELRGDRATEGLRLALELKGSLACAMAIVALGPNIDVGHLEVIVESLPALGMWQHDVVATIAGRLDRKLLARTLDIVFACESDIDAAESIVALFPYFDDRLRDRVVTGIERKLKNIAAVVALEGIAPQLSRKLANAAARVARGIAEPALRARAIAAIIPRLEGAVRDRLLSAGMDAAMRPGEAWPRADAIVRLIPNLDQRKKKKAIRAAIRLAASAAKNRKYRNPGGPLLGLLPEMSETDLAASLENLLAIEPVARAEAFAHWKAPIKNNALSVIRRKFAEHLLSIRDLDRAEVLRVLALPLCAPPVFTPNIVAAIGLAIIDVASKWTWP
jgi:hypothetical protein